MNGDEATDLETWVRQAVASSQQIVEPSREVVVGPSLGLRELWAPLTVVESVPEARFPPEELGAGIDDLLDKGIGLIGNVASWANRPPYGRPLLELIDEAFATGQASPAVVVSVDGWTRYGGSQYVDSNGTGRYHSYLCDEIVPYVDDRYRTIAERGHRAVMGKSSGGFGALVAAMLRPDIFGACASHAGDAFYEVVYQPHMREVVRGLRSWDGDIMTWWKDFQARCPDVLPGERILEYVLGVSACFSPDADGAPMVPIDTRTGELREDVWRKWLGWDPVRMIPQYPDQLRSLRGVWIDAGSADEFFLDLGARALHRALRKIGMAGDALHLDIVAGADHEAIGRRQVDSLCWLTEKLSRAEH